MNGLILLVIGLVCGAGIAWVATVMLAPSKKIFQGAEDVTTIPLASLNKIPCDNCDGAGVYFDEYPESGIAGNFECPECNGSGWADNKGNLEAFKITDCYGPKDGKPQAFTGVQLRNKAGFLLCFIPPVVLDEMIKNCRKMLTPATCTWRIINHGDYHTSCHMVRTIPPSDDYKNCPYCGKKLKVIYE